MRLKPIVIIPARGGSKGVPKKNITPLCGKRLICYTLDVARELFPPERIILSTESEEIAEAAKLSGYTTDYRRPPEFATDTAGSREVILDAMDYADQQGIDYNCIVLLQPTSPLRVAEDVRCAMEIYADREGELDMVVSVCESLVNPYYNCFEEGTDGYLHISKGEGRLTRRQEAPKAYQINGAVYVINPRSIRSKQFGEFSRRVPSMMPRERSIDIDEPVDLVVAESILKYKTAK